MNLTTTSVPVELASAASETSNASSIPTVVIDATDTAAISWSATSSKNNATIRSVDSFASIESALVSIASVMRLPVGAAQAAAVALTQVEALSDPPAVLVHRQAAPNSRTRSSVRVVVKR